MQAPTSSEAGAEPRFGLFGDFDFPLIFDQPQFAGMRVFRFEPGTFIHNFHNNFRSSNAFEELL